MKSMISRQVTAIGLLGMLLLTSCSGPNLGYEYYMELDESHEDIYPIELSFSSDGDCRITIGHGHTFNDFAWGLPESLEDVIETKRLYGNCTSSNFDYDLYEPVYLSFFGYFPDIDLESINSKKVFDVIPAEWVNTEYPDTPIGLYFRISMNRKIKRSLNIFCNVELRSISGDVTLQRDTDGVLTMNISGLSYAAERCFT